MELRGRGGGGGGEMSAPSTSGLLVRAGLFGAWLTDNPLAG